MSSYKKYFSTIVSAILLPLLTAALTKLMNRQTEKFEQDPYTKGNEAPIYLQADWKNGKRG